MWDTYIALCCNMREKLHWHSFSEPLQTFCSSSNNVPTTSWGWWDRYKRRTFVLLYSVNVCVYGLSKGFDFQMKQPLWYLAFAKKIMRIINWGLNDLFAHQTHLQDLHHLGSSAVHFHLAQDNLWWCLVVFQLVPLFSSVHFISRIPNRVALCRLLISLVTGLGRYEAYFHKL